MTAPVLFAKAAQSRLVLARAHALLGRYNPDQPRDDEGQWTDGVPGAPVVDKLKLGKRAPYGFTVRSSKKIKTDYADVGIAEIDSPYGPQIRVGIIGNESGKWDAGFTGESRKAELRQEIDRKQALMDSDSDDVDDDIEDQISELRSELEDLEGERTAIVPPQAMADFRRQLDEALKVAQANKAEQDAAVKELDALDEKRDALIAEHSDAALEKSISRVSEQLRSKLKIIKRLENGPNPRHWDAEDIAELLEMHKADVPELEAELALLLARRAELMPADARARLEDLDRQFAALNEADIDDMLTSAEVSAPNGARIRAEIWGSDDEDEQWVSTRLYVLTPGETSDDIDDDYGSFRGLKGLNKLIAGLEPVGGTVRNVSQVSVRAVAPLFFDRVHASRRRITAHLPGRHDQDKHAGDGPNLGPLHGSPVLDADEYEEAYGDVVDERSLETDDDGMQLSVRFFDRGDAHLVIDLPEGRRQVIGEFDDSDSMRALADGIREVQHAKIPDGDVTGDIVADHNSHQHPFYVAKDDYGDVRLRDDDAGEDDYLEFGTDEAWELFDALNDLADSFDNEFGEEEDEDDDE